MTRIDVPSSSQVAGLVDTWQRAGIVTPDQARRMLETPVPTPVHTKSMVSRPILVEVAGYLGGAIVAAATLIIGTRYWEHLGTPARLLTIGVAAAALLAAGLLVPRRTPAGRRLSPVLLLASTVAVCGFWAVVATETPSWHAHATVTVAALTSAWAALLSVVRPGLVQHAVLAWSASLTAASGLSDVTQSDAWPGVGAWGVGLCWLLLVQLQRTRHHADEPLAAATMVLGALFTLPSGWGFALALTTILAVALLAVRRHDLWLTVVAALGTLQALPAAAVELFPDASAAPFVLLAVGLVIVALSVRSALRPHDRVEGDD